MYGGDGCGMGRELTEYREHGCTANTVIFWMMEWGESFDKLEVPEERGNSSRTMTQTTLKKEHSG